MIFFSSNLVVGFTRLLKYKEVENLESKLKKINNVLLDQVRHTSYSNTYLIYCIK